MPTNKWGFPFQYATKPGGFFYEVEDDPENSNFAEWTDEITFNGDGSFTMEPQGATDFGLGKNISSFSDAIGGCGMSFADTVARGYMFKADDPRDLEITGVFTFDNIASGNDMSISSRTGHHTSDNCCQGFAYMFGSDPNTNPVSFRFRKEMWHVSYHESPEGNWTHPSFNFKLNGHAKVGLGLTIYNKPGTTNRVVLEAWGNPNPVANPTNWIMLKRIEDFPGNGWGNDGGDCDGDDDQVGTWSGPQSRFKTNSSGGSITFEKISMREIDPSRALDDTGTPPPDDGGGTPNPVPTPTPPGGGGTQPTTITPVITYGMSNAKTVYDDPIPGYSSVNQITELISSQIIAAMVNPDPHARFGPSGWERDGADTATGFDIQQGVCTGATDDTKYADGLGVSTYWSNSANACIAPGLANGTTGTNTNDVTYHGGRIMKNPHIHLIFWNAGRTDWRTRTETPTMDQIVTEIRDKLLGTDKQYFSGIQQYGAPGIPVWGTGGTTTGGTNPVPTPTPGDVPPPVTSISPALAYCAIGCITANATAEGVTNLQFTTMTLSEEIIETQTDPTVGSNFLNLGAGWYGTSLDPDEVVREIGDAPCDIETGSFRGIYADGLAVSAYWSNSHNNCIIPGITANDIGNSTAITYHGGMVMKNPVINLIFWGTEWTTQTSPTKAQVIAEVQNKLLGTDATFFSGINQYSSCGTPVYGTAVQNNNLTYPTSSDHSSVRAAIETVIKNSLTTGLLPITNNATMMNIIYVVFLPKNKVVYLDDATTTTGGYHAMFGVTLPV